MASKGNGAVEKIRKFQRQNSANTKCADCQDAGPTYICLDFLSFVCLTCSGVHREFTHKVKGISVTKWTDEDIQSLIQNGGNAKCNAKYLATWTSASMPEPAPFNVGAIREMIQAKYIEKRWMATEPVKPAKPAAESSSLQDRYDAKGNLKEKHVHISTKIRPVLEDDDVDDSDDDSIVLPRESSSKKHSKSRSKGKSSKRHGSSRASAGASKPTNPTIDNSESPVYSTNNAMNSWNTQMNSLPVNQSAMQPAYSNYMGMVSGWMNSPYDMNNENLMHSNANNQFPLNNVNRQDWSQLGGMGNAGSGGLAPPFPPQAAGNIQPSLWYGSTQVNAVGGMGEGKGMPNTHLLQQAPSWRQNYMQSNHLGYPQQREDMKRSVYPPPIYGSVNGGNMMNPFTSGKARMGTNPFESGANYGYAGIGYAKHSHMAGNFGVTNQNPYAQHMADPKTSMRSNAYQIQARNRNPFVEGF